MLGVLAFVAGIAVAGIPFEVARRKRSSAEIVLLLSLTRYGVALVGVGAILLFACGLWLAGLEEIGLGTGWLAAAILTFLLALVLGGLGGKRPKQARILAGELTDRRESPSAELRALLDDPLARGANYGSTLLIVVVLILMVFKP